MANRALPPYPMIVAFIGCTHITISRVAHPSEPIVVLSGNNILAACNRYGSEEGYIAHYLLYQYANPRKPS